MSFALWWALVSLPGGIWPSFGTSGVAGSPSGGSKPPIYPLEGHSSTCSIATGPCATEPRHKAGHGRFSPEILGFGGHPAGRWAFRGSTEGTCTALLGMLQPHGLRKVGRHEDPGRDLAQSEPTWANTDWATNSKRLKWTYNGDPRCAALESATVTWNGDGASMQSEPPTSYAFAEAAASQNGVAPTSPTTASSK